MMCETCYIQHMECMQSHLQKGLVSYLRKIQKNICMWNYIAKLALPRGNDGVRVRGCEKGACHMVLFSERLLIL